MNTTNAGTSWADDPAALDYVPEQLRPYFDPAPLDRLDARDAWATYDTRARADVIRRDAAALARLAQTQGRHFDPDMCPDGPLLVAVHGSPDAARTLPPLSDVEQLRAEHLARLAAARELHDAERSAAERERARRESACPVCSAHVGAGLGAPSGPGSDPGDVRLCQPCRAVVAQLRVDAAGEQLVRDGHTRAELAAGWLST